MYLNSAVWVLEQKFGWHKWHFVMRHTNEDVIDKMLKHLTSNIRTFKVREKNG
jgi:hypothetical protein